MIVVLHGPMCLTRQPPSCRHADARLGVGDSPGSCKCSRFLDTRCDVGSAHCLEGIVLVDFAGTLGSLLQSINISAEVPGVPQWLATFKGDLASAVSGGQWSQTRRAKVAKEGINDKRCQLCLSQLDTLSYRCSSRCTVPPEGWPQPLAKAALVLGRIGVDRVDMLRARVLLVLELPAPPAHHEGWFHWFMAPPPEADDCYTWCLDGSMRDGDWTDYRAVGFAIVMVAPSGNLAAYGPGVPPSWCATAAAGEAWALHIGIVAEPTATSAQN